MFETISSEGVALVPGPAVGSLHGSYPYLRLFFGRFLADVSVSAEGHGRVGWLIPGGAASPPAPARVRRELAALGQAMLRAHQEIHGPAKGRSKGAEAVRQTMATQVLAEWRVPLAAGDVRFNHAGEMFVVNWCTDQPGGSRRLADWEPRRVIQRLAGGLKVPAPDLRPMPTPRFAPAPRPSPRRAPAEPAHPFAPARPARPGFGRKTWHWALLGLAMLGMLVSGITIGHKAGYAKAQSLADHPSDGGKGSIESPANPTFDLASSVMPSATLAMVFHRMGSATGAYDRVTIWVPLRAEGPLAAQARQFGSLVDTNGRLLPGQFWLVYGQDYPHDGGRIGPVSYRLEGREGAADPVHLGMAMRAPMRQYDGTRLRSSPPVRRSTTILHWRVW